jgi:pentatricopeptide repeat protein
MESLGLEASMITYSGMLSGLARNRQVSEMERVIETMKERNIVLNDSVLGDIINKSDSFTVDKAVAVLSPSPSPRHRCTCSRSARTR